MAIEKISGHQALINAKKPLAKYPTPKFGSNRLFPNAHPEPNTSFKIKREDKIFTIGSCFAREVDSALSYLGFSVISKADETETINNVALASGDFNKYNVLSIEHDIAEALGITVRSDSYLFLKSGKNNDSFVDPILGGSHKGSISDLKQRRAHYNSTMQKIKEADVVIITLGLAEVWYHEKTKTFLNLAPPASALHGERDDFSVLVLEYNDIFASLSRILEMLKQNLKDNFKLLITVSPVPLLSTFRDQDCLVANTYSKSVQRAAVEQFVKINENVDYFPSYEFVSLNNPKNNWVNDYRHVHPNLVRRIMANVLAKYCDDERVQAYLINDKINSLYKLGMHDEVIQFYLTTESNFIDDLALYRVGLCYKKNNSFQEALSVFRKCVERNPNNESAVQNVNRMLSSLSV